MSGEYRLYQRALDVDTLRIVDKKYHPIPITNAERDEALDQDFYHDMAGQGADIDPELIPPVRPAWTSFTVDREGYLWVVPQIPDSMATALDLFDPEGRYLGRRSAEPRSRRRWRWVKRNGRRGSSARTILRSR